MIRARAMMMMKVCAALALASAIAASGRAGDPPEPPRRLGETLRALIAKAAPAVVRIEVDKEDPTKDDPRRRLFADPESLRHGDDGSGVILREDGLVLTHRSLVLAEDARIVVATASGKRLRAEVLARDRELDVALLKVDAGEERLPALPIGTIEGLAPGRVVVALGNPFGVARDARASASLGIVSAIARLDARELVYQGDVVVTDAATNPGNEGGPLIDLDGRMVGLLAPLVRDRRSDSIVAVAIPMDAIVPKLEVLAKGGGPGRLGILCVPAERDARGIRVARVIPGSPAEAAGVREGDRIASLDGEPIDGVAALGRALEPRRAGAVATLAIDRGGAKLELKVKLGEAP